MKKMHDHQENIAEGFPKLERASSQLHIVLLVFSFKVISRVVQLFLTIDVSSTASAAHSVPLPGSSRTCSWLATEAYSISQRRLYAFKNLFATLGI